MQTFEDFFNQLNGQKDVGDTPENKGQCVGLIEVWLDNLSQPHIWGDAQDLYANAIPLLYQVIPNSSTNVPEKGDIVIFPGSFNNGAGHCGIATGIGNTDTFEMFEQNDPLGSGCHTQTYKYEFVPGEFVTGWIRPKNIPAQSVAVDPQTFTKLVHNSTVSDDVNDYFSLPHNSDFEPTIKNALDELKNHTTTVIYPSSSGTGSSTVPNTPPVQKDTILRFINWLKNKNIR